MLVHRLPMACFSDQALEFSTTEREPGKLLFFVFSISASFEDTRCEHLCFGERAL